VYLYFFYIGDSYCKIILTCLYKAVILSSKEASSIEILSLRILKYNIIKTVVSKISS